MSFANLGLSAELVRAVAEHGYTTPTPIQTQAIPAVLAGGDLLAGAQTGTGKTAGFVLPILQLLSMRAGATTASGRKPVRVLILAPTRELAAQIEESVRVYGKYSKQSSTVVFGGVGINPQMIKLKRGVDILVATPGRLLDLQQQRAVDLSHIEILVLDEADRMLDMGFIHDIRKVVAKLPIKRQNLFFSATMPPEISGLTQWVLKEPEVIEIGLNHSPAETVTHALYPVDIAQKQDLLEELLRRTDYDQVLIFCRTKNGADRVARKLQQQGHAVAVLHSSRTQPERERALKGFRDGRYEVMVATDIAARGIDVEQISHVINFDVPHHPEDYVHRIGRTGRAQSVGDAFTIMTGEDVQEVAAIERFIGQKIPRVKLDGFNYSYTRLLDPNPKPIFGGGRSPGKRSFGYGRRRR